MRVLGETADVHLMIISNLHPLNKHISQDL